MSPTPMIDFADLHLTAGYPIQLQVIDGNAKSQRHFCRLVGCVKGESILTSHLQASGELLNLAAGARVTVRLMTGRGIAMFTSEIIHSQEQPLPMLYLSYPDALEFTEIRNAARVDIHLPVRIANSLSQDQIVTGWIKDISFSGARIEIEEPVAAIGDEINLSSDLAIENLYEHFNTHAAVRSRSQSAAKDRPERTILGVEFLEDNPSKKILLYAYVSYQLAQSCLPVLREH